MASKIFPRLLLLIFMILLGTACVRTSSKILTGSEPKQDPEGILPEIDPTLVGTPVLTSSTPAQSLEKYPSPTVPALTPTTLVASKSSQEFPVLPIQLSPPLNNPQAEISGLDWYQDFLVMLPQYPERFAANAEEQGALFMISKDSLINYLDSSTPQPLEAIPLPIYGADFTKLIPGYEGFEAIAFSGETIFFIIETTGRDSRAYLLTGQVKPGLTGIHIQPATVSIPLNVDSPNLSAESLVVFGRRVLAIPEVNYFEMATDPTAALFDFDLVLQNSLRLTNQPYRITDASQVNDNGIFWVINYFYPGETELSGKDPIKTAYPPGPTHQQLPQVERLVAYQFRESGLALADQPVIWLELALDGRPRNWEGLAILTGKGFLIATDEFPGTILALVPYSGAH